MRITHNFDQGSVQNLIECNPCFSNKIGKYQEAINEIANNSLSSKTEPDLVKFKDKGLKVVTIPLDNTFSSFIFDSVKGQRPKPADSGRVKEYFPILGAFPTPENPNVLKVQLTAMLRSYFFKDLPHYKEQIEEFNREVAFFKTLQGSECVPEFYGHYIYNGTRRISKGPVECTKAIILLKNYASLIDDIDLRISEKRPYSFDEICTFGTLALKALVQIHNQGIIHNDISPSNMFVEKESGRIKKVVFGDFGTATTLNELKNQNLYKRYAVSGNPAYLSLEKWEHRMNAEDPQIFGQPTDMWNLGLVFHWMFNLEESKVMKYMRQMHEHLKIYESLYALEDIVRSEVSLSEKIDINQQSLEIELETLRQSISGLNEMNAECLDSIPGLISDIQDPNGPLTRKKACQRINLCSLVVQTLINDIHKNLCEAIDGLKVQINQIKEINTLSDLITKMLDPSTSTRITPESALEVFQKLYKPAKTSSSKIDDGLLNASSDQINLFQRDVVQGKKLNSFAYPFIKELV